MLTNTDLTAIEKQCEATSSGTVHQRMSFIAHARADIPALIADVRELRKLMRLLIETPHKNRASEVTENPSLAFGSAFLCVYCEAGASVWNEIRHYAHCPLQAARLALEDKPCA